MTTRIATAVTILMPFDGSPQALRTFPVAQTIARVMAGSLHFVLSGDKTEARKRLPLPADPGSEIHELLGDSVRGIVRLANVSPDTLIVTPAYGTTRPESGVGPFPEQLLQLAECPVLLVQPGAAWPTWNLQRILVPQDGTADAAKALCPATRLAERSGAEVLILHVTSKRSKEAPQPGAMEFPAYADQPHHEWESWVTGFLHRVRRLCKLSPRTALRFHWAHGDPGQEILAVARRKKVDLIAISWSRCVDPGRAQIVRKVLRGASCPVLVLPRNSED